MTPQNRFKLTRQAMLLATISAAFPVTAYCAAGRVDFVIGNVESVAANGIRHPLAKGSEIDAGETISTAAGARAQVHFADGGFVSLQPNTQFRVDQFNYRNKTDGEERGSQPVERRFPGRYRRDRPCQQKYLPRRDACSDAGYPRYGLQHGAA